MRNSVKTALFVSAFSPALLSVAVARAWANGFHWDVACYAIFGLLGLLPITYIMSAIRLLGEDFPFRAKKIKANDALMLSVISTYFIPFFGKAADVSIGIVLIVLTLAAAAFWFSTSIPPSPALRLLKYRFYEVESEGGVVYTLISQRELIDPRNITRVKRISSAMLVEVM